MSKEVRYSAATVSVAGNTIMPGDWIRADDDGACFFPGAERML
jgi:regulator of RNase E activity RraA